MKRKIKSITLTSEFEAIYVLPEGEVLREPITGFAVCRCSEAGERYDDVEPFTVESFGVDFCSDSTNYRGIVRVGEPTPEVEP
jgi:hypothetical protein